MEHLTMNGAYWGLTTLDLLGKLRAVDVNQVVSWIIKCQHNSGGFGGNVGHDPHILYTLSVVQFLALFNKLDVLDIEKVSNYVAGLQNEDGSFLGDMWGEVDTCVEKAVSYIVSLQNPGWWIWMHTWWRDSCWPNFLLCGCSCYNVALHHIDKDLLGCWLCEHQVKSGGLNGCPEKLPDVDMDNGRISDRPDDAVDDYHTYFGVAVI